MQNINIGIEIDPQKLLKTRMLFQAGSGGGKSYGLRKLIESIGNKVQQIILDPEGEFASLREKFDFLLVGKDGDIPLNVHYAETLANMVLETGISVIIDLYELHQGDRILFVKQFVNSLVDADKKLWHPVFIYIDEAHIFCPEDRKAESTQAVIDLCTRGRKRGYCPILATQRLPVLNKNATAQCYNKIIGLNTQDIDRKRAGEELGMTTKADFISLRNLEPGEFYAFGPAISRGIIKFNVSPVETSHQESGTQMASKPPTPKAVARILEKFSAIPQEAEKELNTKQQLQAEVTRLRGEVTRMSKGNSDANLLTSDKFKIIAQAKQEAARSYQTIIKDKEKYIKDIQDQNRTLSDMIEKIVKLAGGIPSTLLVTIPKPHKQEGIPPSRETYSSPPRNIIAPLPVREGDYNPGKCARTILGFLAGYLPKDFTKAQLAVATNYSAGSGGFNNALAELNTRGLIVRGNRLKANEAHLSDITAILGEIRPLEYSLETFKGNLSKCEAEIYEVLLAGPHDTYSKESIAGKTVTGYSPGSGGFNNSLSRLSTLEIIVRERGGIRLNPELLELI